MLVRRLVFIVIWILSLLVSAGSQQRDQKSTKPAKSPDAVSTEAELLRSSATYLLRNLVQSGNEIDNVAERVRALADIGDALWSVDRDDARAVLVRSFQEIDKLSVGGDRDRVISQTRSLRRIVLARIARHDEALASQLVHSLPAEPVTPENKLMQMEGVATPNADALLGIAENLLASDAKRAVALAGFSLQDGLSQRLRLFLIELRAKDPAAADALAEAALRQASLQHPGRLFDVLLLWDYVYQPPNFYLNGIVWNREKNEMQAQASAILKRAVLTFAVTAVMENVPQPGAAAESDQDKRLALTQTTALYSVIQQILPSLQADLPRGAIDLQQALARVAQELQTAGQTPPERPAIKDETESATLVDSLLAKAAAASQGEARDSLYLEASFRLLQLRQYERAKDIAGKIDDLDRRAMVVEPLDFYRAGELIEKGSLTDALSVAYQLKTPELRINALARIGENYFAKGAAQEGLEALNAARSSASKAEPTIELCAATLRIASALIKDDQLQAAEVVALAIQIANKLKDDNVWPLISASPATNTLSFSWKNAPGGGLKSIKTMYPRNGGLVDLLSKLEFDRAVSLAREIKSKGVAMAAQAGVCRAAIESTQAKIVAGRSH